MTEKTRFDMIMGEFMLEKDIVVEEYHGSSDIIGSPPEEVDSAMLITG